MEEENENSYVEEKYVSNELIFKVNKERNNSRSSKQPNLKDKGPDLTVLWFFWGFILGLGGVVFLFGFIWFGLVLSF